MTSEPEIVNIRGHELVRVPLPTWSHTKRLMAFVHDLTGNKSSCGLCPGYKKLDRLPPPGGTCTWDRDADGDYGNKMPPCGRTGRFIPAELYPVWLLRKDQI